MIAQDDTFDLVPGSASLMKVADLLNVRLSVPAFQRPYDWREKQVLEFVDDLEACATSGSPLFLGLVVLHRLEDGTYEIIDGQQRITSLVLLLGAFGVPPTKLPRIREDDQLLFERLVSDTDHHADATVTTQSQLLLKSASGIFGKKSSTIARAAREATCIAYVSPEIESATSLFERINMRGREVSQFDLVKNRLISWVALLDRDDPEKRYEMLSRITRGYNELYRILNPTTNPDSSLGTEYDANRLLRVHWILHTTSSFKSSDRVIVSIEEERTKQVGADLSLSEFIKNYLDSLTDVARHWVTLQSPERLPADAHPQFRAALHEFHRLDRAGEFEPLIVASILRFGDDREAVARFVRFCTICSFREALARKNSNSGRSQKWTMARDLAQRKLKDATGVLVESTAQLAHQFYWRNALWWDLGECESLGWDKAEFSLADSAAVGLDTAKFYQELGRITHYFFWEYGKVLGNGGTDIYGSTLSQANPFKNDEFWFEFRRKWDIEHVFPQRPDEKAAKEQKITKKNLKDHEKVMQQYLHRLGNLTVVPQRDNRGLLSNGDFDTKRKAMLDITEVNFNKLFTESKYIGHKLTLPFWGPNNCMVRFGHLTHFANRRWGAGALEELGVGEFDKSVDHQNYLDEDDENEDQLEILQG